MSVLAKSDVRDPAVRDSCSGKKNHAPLLGFATLAVVFLIYAPSLWHGFSLVDDEYFVRGNPVVQNGIAWAGIHSAWTSVHASYWAPLLWMSFMVDQEISGGAPWSFHLANIMLFAASAGLLYVLVRRWTGRPGIAIATAFLWALHPARVESVAWITERKDVLSGLFFLSGLWFYTVGREQPSRSAGAVHVPNSPDAAPRPPNRLPSPFILQPSSLIFLAWLCMLLGGMAKQSIIVMPIALVLLDVWPLGRTDWSRFWRDGWRLIGEKWAFWLLAASYASLPIWTHLSEDAFLDASVARRAATLPIHYLFYLQKMAWPTALAPLQDDLPLVGWQAVLGLVLLILATAVAWRFRRQAPWALWGWAWFVGTLFPLSGVVWAGSERVAVRWLYLPQIGLTLALALAFEEWGRRLGVPGRWTRMACALTLILLSVVTLRTLFNWRNPNAFGLWIWECHPHQAGACAMGGDALMARGDRVRAMKAYEQGAEMGDKPCFLRVCMLWNQLGHADRTFDKWGDIEKDMGHPLTQFEGWERPSEKVLLWLVRGQALRARGDFTGAIAALKEAVFWENDDGALVLADYLRACYDGGRPEEGAETAARLSAATGVSVRGWRDLFPFYAQMWKSGARGYAYGYFAEYAERFPEDAVNLNYMAWLLATASPDGLDHARKDEWPAAAVRWAEQSLAASEDPPVGVWNVLAAARANAGDSTGAVVAAEKARDLALQKKNKALAAEIEKRIATYRMGLAWRE